MESEESGTPLVEKRGQLVALGQPTSDALMDQLPAVCQAGNLPLFVHC